MKTLYTILVFLATSLLLSAQDSLVLDLETVGISAKRIETKQSFSPSSSNETFQQYLSRQTAVQFKANSPLGLASIAARGTTAAQTTLTWNGINIQNNMNGVTDFNLVNANQVVGQLVLDYENGSLNSGNGGIGATIAIQDELKELGKSIGVGLEMASFDQYVVQAFIQEKHLNHWYYAKTSAQSAKNNFRYRNTTQIGQPEERQRNAAGQLYHANLGYGWNSHHNGFGIRHQFTYGERQIPPNMLAANVNAHQTDRMHRLLLDYFYDKNTLALKAKTALLDDYILYTQNGIYAPSHSRAYLGQVQVKWQYQKWQFQAQTEYRSTVADADGYAATVTREQSENSINAYYQAKQWALRVGLGKHFYSDFEAPFIGGLKLDYHFHTKHQFRLHLSKNFRVPTLNDLFWQQGGNPNLLPESSWNQSLTYIYTQNKRKLSATAYSIFIQDMIVWQPQSSGFWTPQNIQKVWSKGLELQWEQDWTFEYLKIKNNIQYALTLSSTYEDEPLWTGIQLPYVAKHQVKENLSLNYKNWGLDYGHQWFSKRFTNDGKKLPQYDWAALRLTHVYKVRNINLTTRFSIENIYNKSFVSVQHYAMPGRTYRLGVRLSRMSRYTITPRF